MQPATELMALIASIATGVRKVTSTTGKPPETLWGRKLTDQSGGYFAADEWLAQSAIAKGDMTADLPLISFTSWANPVPKKLQRLCSNVRIVATSDDLPSAVQK